MNVNLTPLQLVLIAIVIVFLCLLLKHLVEADTSSPPSSKQTCGDWLKDKDKNGKDNKSKCKNSIKFWEKPCSDNNCNESTCCDPNKEYDYCTKYVTQGSQNLKYCMKTNVYCSLNPNATPKECKDNMTWYCRDNPNATPKECKGHIRLWYCSDNPNALYKDCKDYMSFYCRNPNVVNKEKKHLECDQ
jgi:hypothetical protein